MVSTQVMRLLRSQQAQRFAIPLPRRVITVPLIQRESIKSFSTSSISRADTPEAQTISAVAKAEGGPTKGSGSAKMQSQLAKQRNAEQGTSGVNTNQSPEGQAISEVARAEGGTAKGSLSAKLQSEVTKKKNAEQGLSGSSSNGTGASAKTPVGQVISEVAHAEGGTAKGSQSAQMQSEVTKAMNAGQDVSGNSSAGGSAKSPAGQAISEIAHAEGGTNKGSQSARMQSELTKAMNAEQGTGTDKTPAAQAISEVAHAEGGPSKGSKSAQMQSKLDKATNAQGGSGTSKSTAGQAISGVAHIEGGTTKGSLSAKMQSELTKAINSEKDL